MRTTVADLVANNLPQVFAYIAPLRFGNSEWSRVGGRRCPQNFGVGSDA